MLCCVLIVVGCFVLCVLIVVGCFVLCAYCCGVFVLHTPSTLWQESTPCSHQFLILLKDDYSLN